MLKYQERYLGGSRYLSRFTLLVLFLRFYLSLLFLLLRNSAQRKNFNTAPVVEDHRLVQPVLVTLDCDQLISRYSGTTVEGATSTP